ncbi:glycosyltransferase [Geothrix sp. 21YS21S-4]|uniref:UDP-N-acetylglucosamine--N-acetylmuramyl- (pentapeptide) pyrophosphoryl-undecaprenol N-acetylglucosamine transferase n=1 Tax=Geothrix sp. 21YS21S-4 TaxID=3068889 RepID=UPI0027B8A3F2|nr:glycosyltransferase [Geothrix sp. 21YS21S-4]
MHSTTPAFAGTLVLTGGGTGGHFFPALALAEAAQARWPGRPVAFVGARRGIEARELPGGPWPHLLLDVEGFLGRSPLKAARAAWKLWRATGLLKALWRRERPWAVIGTGGYAAAPALLAARAMGIPFFLHESNAAPGALAKLVAPKAGRVWCGLEAVKPLLPGADCRVVGTPVRAAFLRAFRPAGELSEPFRLLAVGGSGGARAVNEALLSAAPALLEAFPDWELLHQVGRAEMQRLAARPRHGRHALVPFIAAMDEAMEGASLVVGRAGASTCAELKAAGRGAVLVPIPGSANDHQRKNAEALAAEGRAVVVEQDVNLAARLTAALEPLMADAGARQSLSGTPQPNRAVDLCLDDLASYLGGAGSAIQATRTEMK